MWRNRTSTYAPRDRAACSEYRCRTLRGTATVALPRPGARRKADAFDRNPSGHERAPVVRKRAPSRRAGAGRSEAGRAATGPAEAGRAAAAGRTGEAGGAEAGEGEGAVQARGARAAARRD